MKKNKSQTQTSTWFYLWGARASAIQAGCTTKELLQQGLTLEHENLSRAGIALQNLWSGAEWDILQKQLPAGTGRDLLVVEKRQRTSIFQHKQMLSSVSQELSSFYCLLLFLKEWIQNIQTGIWSDESISLTSVIFSHSNPNLIEGQK